LSIDLRKLLSTEDTPRRRIGSGIYQTGADGLAARMLKVRKSIKPGEVSSRWETVMTLDIRGFSLAEIHERTGISVNRICVLRRTERYREAKAARLHAIDDDFVSLKPLAMDALRRGLNDVTDNNVALRASEQWFKTAGYGQHGKTGDAPAGATAESIAAAILKQQINVTVNVNGAVADAGISVDSENEQRITTTGVGEGSVIPQGRLRPISDSDEEFG
jgi:hypothetical protein